MITIAVANTKGGVGKTTLCAALAVRAAKDFDRVAMVDLDPQKSLAAWWERRGQDGSPEMYDGPDVAVDAVESLEADGWDCVFIDGPPAFLTVVEESIQAADVTVIPVKPSMLDLSATQDAVALARETEASYLVVLNDVHAREKLAASARKMLKGAGVPVAKAEIPHRVAHTRCMTVGKTAAEVDGGKHRDAANEIDALWAEVKAAANKARKRQSGA